MFISSPSPPSSSSTTTSHQQQPTNNTNIIININKITTNKKLTFIFSCQWPVTVLRHWLKWTGMIRHPKLLRSSFNLFLSFFFLNFNFIIIWSMVSCQSCHVNHVIFITQGDRGWYFTVLPTTKWEFISKSCGLSKTPQWKK